MSDGLPLPHHTAIARRKLNAPADWQVCGWRRIGPDGLIVTGGVPRIVERGPNKGRPVFDATEECVVVESEVELEMSLHTSAGGESPLKTAAAAAGQRCNMDSPFTEADLRRLIFAAPIGGSVPVTHLAPMRAFLEGASAATLTLIASQMASELNVDIGEFRRAIRILRDDLAIPAHPTAETS